MNREPGYCVANAYLDHQITIVGGWDPRQQIALELADWDGILEPVEAELTSGEARDLAFGLLMLAELADHRARGEQP
jgi:hypothetical protein